MMSTYWKAKSDGYELVDGSTYSPSSSLQSSPTVDIDCDYPTATRRTKIPSLTSQILLRLRQNRRKVILIFSAIIAIVTLESILRVILAPPAYVVLEPEHYLETLEATVRDRIPLQSLKARQALLTNLQSLRLPFSSLYDSVTMQPTPSIVPNNLFSSDKHAPPSDWAAMWKTKGFEPHFYNDEEANAWVESQWRGTDVIAAWKLMPRSILRADLLRYLFLLLEGGTWSDMDTVPVKHLSNWTTDTIPFHHKYSDKLKQSSPLAASVRDPEDKRSNNAMASPPIRGILSLECVPKWSSLRGAIELLHIKPLDRHRNLQVVQWTIHLAPHHPILVDVLRRILETMDLYRAYLLEMKRENRRVGWGWYEFPTRPVHQSAMSKASPSSIREDKEISPASINPAPWEMVGHQWVYTRGHWRLGWHSTSVEEWTGPGVWTDAVISYIYATTGIRPEELATIKKPTQIGDLIILPEYGFNPPKGSVPDPFPVSRVVHLFRGSWKHKQSASHP